MLNTVAAETEREQRFTRWVADYGESILRMCIVYLKNVSDAEDAAQDTFLYYLISKKCVYLAWIFRSG